MGAPAPIGRDGRPTTGLDRGAEASTMGAMKLVVPFESAAALVKELDNGGRWFNLFTRGGDGVVEEAELKAAAGAWTLPSAALYLALARIALNDADQRELDR